MIMFSQQDHLPRGELKKLLKFTNISLAPTRTRFCLISGRQVKKFLIFLKFFTGPHFSRGKIVFWLNEKSLRQIFQLCLLMIFPQVYGFFIKLNDCLMSLMTA